MIYKKGDILTIFDKYTEEEVRVVVMLPIQLGNRQFYRVMRMDTIGEKESRQFLIKPNEIITHLAGDGPTL